MKLNNLICVVFLVLALSAEGTLALDIPNRWADHTHTSYLTVDFGPIDGSWSWGVVDAAINIRCRNDSSFVTLLENLDPVQPDKVMVWEAIAKITEGAAALAAAEIDTTDLTPEEYREQYPHRSMIIMHSGHWWDYWNRLAQLARLAYSDPLLIECLDPQVSDLFRQMEWAFLPYLVVPPEYYFDKRWEEQRDQARRR